MTVLDAGKLALIVATPTLLGAAFLCAPRCWAALTSYWEARHPAPPEPFGPPIEQLAADLRRLLRLHGSMMTSAQMGTLAHRLWAVEAAIGMRAVDAARALGVPHREPVMPDVLTRAELRALLTELAAAGLVLPARVGPFTTDGRI